MKSHRKKMIVLAHNASLSGAPILLYNLLLLLKNSSEIEISMVVIGRPGPLLNQFEQHFPIVLMKPEGYANEGSLLKRLSGILRNRIKLVRVIASIATADLVFSNTVVNGRLLKRISFLKKKTITYVHELEQVLAYYSENGITTNSLQYSSLFAYPSLRVKQVLQQRYDIPVDKLMRLSYYLPVNHQQLNDVAAREFFVQEFRKRFALGEDGLLIVGMGKISHRKGTDIFVNICEQVNRKNKNIRFCWIGDAENNEEQDAINRLVTEKNLGDQIVFTGALPHNYYNLAAFDLFLLSSREDPYPLVVLEAGLMGVPAICFENSGGIAEFTGNDAGWVIPGFEINLAAERILQLYDQKEICREKGRHAREKALRTHVNPVLITEQFYALLK